MLYVTGITGHSGRFFIERLVKEGYTGKIRCAVRPSSDTSYLDRSGLDYEKVVGDLDDQDFLDRTMAGAETVLHIAHIKKTPRVLEAAVKNGVQWAILVHTTGRFSRYREAAEGYIRIEEAALERRNEIGVTVLRPTMIYGSSRDKNMYKLVDYLYRHKFFPMFGQGLNLMQPVHARDLGYAYYDVLMNRDKTFNKEYNLSGGRALPYIEVVRTVSRELGRKNIIVKLPLSLSILAARIYNRLWKNPIISVEQVLRLQEDKAFSFEEARRDFGYNPVPFEEGIKEEVAEYLANIKKLANLQKKEGNLSK